MIWFGIALVPKSGDRGYLGEKGKERRGSFGLSPSLLFLPDLKKNTINLKNKQIYREGTKIKIIKNQCVRQINK